MCRSLAGCLGAVLGVLLTAPLARAQDIRYPQVTVTGRLQVQYYFLQNRDYAAAVGPESNFFLRRARLGVRVGVSDNVTLFLQPSFEGGRTLAGLGTRCEPIAIVPGDTVTPVCTTSGRGGIRLRDAWGEVRFTPKDASTEVAVRVGQQKRPFGRYEQVSSVNLPSIERGAGRGLISRASNDLFDDNGFLSLDVGGVLRLEARHLGRLELGVFNGQGESANDVNRRKSWGGRGIIRLGGRLEVGGSYFRHDAIVGSDSSFVNDAWGADAGWGKAGQPGLFLVADYMEGKDATAARRRMRGISLVAAWNVRLAQARTRLSAIEPSLRFDLADPDTRTSGDHAELLTAGLGLYLAGGAQWRLAYERQWFPGSGAGAISGIRSALTLSF